MQQFELSEFISAAPWFAVRLFSMQEHVMQDRVYLIQSETSDDAQRLIEFALSKKVSLDRIKPVDLSAVEQDVQAGKYYAAISGRVAPKVPENGPWPGRYIHTPLWGAAAV